MTLGICVDWLLVLVARGLVEAPAKYLDSYEGDFVRHGLCFSMGNDDLVHLLFGVYWELLAAGGPIKLRVRTWMRPCCRSLADFFCPVLLEELGNLGFATGGKGKVSSSM